MERRSSQIATKRIMEQEDEAGHGAVPPMTIAGKTAEDLPEDDSQRLVEAAMQEAREEYAREKALGIIQAPLCFPDYNAVESLAQNPELQEKIKTAAGQMQRSEDITSDPDSQQFQSNDRTALSISLRQEEPSFTENFANLYGYEGGVMAIQERIYSGGYGAGCGAGYGTPHHLKVPRATPQESSQQTCGKIKSTIHEAMLSKPGYLKNNEPSKVAQYKNSSSTVSHQATYASPSATPGSPQNGCPPHLPEYPSTNFLPKSKGFQYRQAHFEDQGAFDKLVQKIGDIRQIHNVPQENFIAVPPQAASASAYPTPETTTPECSQNSTPATVHTGSVVSPRQDLPSSILSFGNPPAAQANMRTIPTSAATFGRAPQAQMYNIPPDTLPSVPQNFTRRRYPGVPGSNAAHAENSEEWSYWNTGFQGNQGQI